MKPVTLYTVTAQEVQLADSYTHSRTPGAGPAHFLGAGHALAGVQQQPAGHVFAVGDGGYAVMSPELREALEAPILAAAQYEIEAARRELMAGPWWARVWRALDIRVSWPVWRWPVF